MADFRWLHANGANRWNSVTAWASRLRGRRPAAQETRPTDRVKAPRRIGPIASTEMSENIDAARAHRPADADLPGAIVTETRHDVNDSHAAHDRETAGDARQAAR